MAMRALTPPGQAVLGRPQRRTFAIRASAATDAKEKTNFVALNVTKSSLVNTLGGKTTRNRECVCVWEESPMHAWA